MRGRDIAQSIQFFFILDEAAIKERLLNAKHFYENNTCLLHYIFIYFIHIKHHDKVSTHFFVLAHKKLFYLRKHQHNAFLFKHYNILKVTKL